MKKSPKSLLILTPVVISILFAQSSHALIDAAPSYSASDYPLTITLYNPFRPVNPNTVIIMPNTTVYYPGPTRTLPTPSSGDTSISYSPKNILISNPSYTNMANPPLTSSLESSSDGYWYTNKSGTKTWISYPTSSNNSNLLPLPEGVPLSDYSKYYGTETQTSDNYGSSTITTNSSSLVEIQQQIHYSDLPNDNKQWIDKYIRDAKNGTNLSDYTPLTLDNYLHADTLVNCTAFATTYVNKFGTRNKIRQGMGYEVVDIMVKNGYQRVYSPQSNAIFSSDAKHTGEGHTGLITKVDYKKNEITIAQGAWNNRDQTTVITMSLDDFKAYYPDATYALVN